MSTQRYLVTARKYRPQTFGELVAQEHVSGTLKNALKLDRLAHAYLFSGPRGVGKTSAARILAKAINCTTPLEQRVDQAEPCRSCDSCRDFEEGRSLNIIEVDAASKNKVDDIRELRDAVRIPPQGARKKVYIIDEVHMLSAQAFNALLKTLEEPPPHVMFIFATTEPHKVLPTILSRCQRFDFRRIAVPEIVERLREICAQEDVTADDGSLILIARKGDGALRDALSVFDQAVALCGTDLKYSELTKALGVVEVDLYFDVSRRVIDQDLAGMLRLVQKTVHAGHDLQEFLAGLAEHFRNLLVARTMEDASLVEATEETRRRYAEEAQHFTESDLLRLLTLAEDASEGLKESSQPRLKLETALLKMASIARAADLRQALEKLQRLEELAAAGKFPKDRSGGGSSGTPNDPEGRTTSPSSDAALSGKPDALPKRSATATDPSSGARMSSSPATVGSSSPAPKRDTQSKGAASKAQIGQSRPTASASAEAKRPTPPSRTVSNPNPAVVLGTPALKRGQTTVRGAADEQVGVGVAEPPPSTHDGADRASSASGEIASITDSWTDVLEHVKHDKIQVWSLLHHARPESYQDEVVVIAVPNDFHRRVLSSQDEYVLSQMRSIVRVPLKGIQFVMREDMDASESEETASDFDPYELMQRKRQENPVVRAIFEQFGGELVW